MIYPDADEVRKSASSHARGPLLPIGRPEAALAFGMLAVFVFLILRNVGLHPRIFSDEYSYSQASRLVKASTTSTPLYLYYWVYRLTRHAGTAFLEAARLLNALFFVGAATFIYQTARKVVSEWVAVLVAMLSLIDPINTYTAYFMPEGMFYFAFWSMSWFILCRRQTKPLYYGATAGALLTLLVLVKVNALFLCPGIMAFMAYANYCENPSQWARKSATELASFVAAFLVSRFTLGYIFAGTEGLHIFGSRYGSLAQQSSAPARLSLLTSEISVVLRGHVLGLALLFAVPVASLFVIIFRRRDRAGGDQSLSNVAAYTLILTLLLLVVVAYFTASVVGESPYETLRRLHMRYYNFVFPLLLMVVAGQLTTQVDRRNRYLVFASAAAMGALIVLAFQLLLRSYVPSLIDSPELHGATMTKFSFYFIGVLGIASLLLWTFHQRRGAQFTLFLVLPATVLIGAVNGNSELRSYHMSAEVEDKAGTFAHDELDPLERQRLVVVGSEVAGLYHALFYVDDPKATIMVIPRGAAFDPAAVPSDHDWVLLIGDHALPDGIEDKIVRDGYVLFRLSPKPNDITAATERKTVYFSHPFRFGLIETLDGVSVPQLFERWSDGSRVQIKMASPLPRRFDLRLVARAFGPNSQLPFTMRVGDEVQTFRLSSSITQVSLPFATDGSARTITIEIPQPTSPKQLGESNDNRLLGIALVQMSIETASSN